MFETAKRVPGLNVFTPKLDVANHPCFNPDVYKQAARVHLPVGATVQPAVQLLRPIFRLCQ